LIAGVLFYAFAAVLLVAAIGVITSRNPVHAALFLVLAFVQSACLWLLIEAEFLAIVLVLVYVGAVMVLFLFVVMMLDINVEELRKGFTRYLPLGAAVALIVVLEIGHVIWFKSQGLQFLTAPQGLPADHSNTYGYMRWEILAALVNGAALIGIAGWVVIEAIGRMGSPPPIKAGIFVVVASLGLLYTTFARGEDSIMVPNNIVLAAAVVPLREPSAVDLRARLGLEFRARRAGGVAAVRLDALCALEGGTGRARVR